MRHARVRSQTTLTSFEVSFWPPIPLRWQFLPCNVDIFWATYQPFFVKVFCERPLRLSRKQTALFFPHSLNHVFVFATLHLFLGYTVSQKKKNTIAKYTGVHNSWNFSRFWRKHIQWLLKIYICINMPTVISKHFGTLIFMESFA